MKKLLTLLTCIFLLVSLCALCASAEIYSGTCGDNATWSLNTETKVLTIDGSGYMWDYYENSPEWAQYAPIIKNIIVNEGITNIGAWVFWDCNNLKAVKIPSTMYGFGAGAFTTVQEFLVDDDNDVYTVVDGILYTKDMKTLVAYPGGRKDTSFTIPNNVETIGDCSIQSNNLNEIALTDNVADIGFAIWSFEAFSVSETNPYFTAIDGVLFSKDKKTLINYPSRKSDSNYTVPYGTEIIASDAFFASENLKNLTFPETVKKLRSEAVCECYALTSITFETTDSLEIGFIAWCENLAYITSYASSVNVSNYEWFLEGCHEDILVRCIEGSSLDEIARELGYEVKYISSTPCQTHTFSDWKMRSVDGVIERYRVCDICIIEEVESVIDETIVDVQQCGDNLFWILYTNGTLKICGKGKMWNYYWRIPWNEPEKISRVFIEKGVDYFEFSLFANCNNITEYIVEGENTFCTAVDGILYTKDMQTLIAYPSAKTETEFIVPDNVVNFGSYSTFNNSNLVSITLGSGVNELVEGIFANARGMRRGLAEIKVSPENNNFCAIDGVLFSKDLTTLIRYPAKKTWHILYNTRHSKSCR